MTDPEFKEKCDKYRQKLEIMFSSGFFELQNGAIQVNFGKHGEMSADIIRKHLFSID